MTGLPKFEVTGLAQAHWSNASPIRKIYRDAFSIVDSRILTRTALETPLLNLAKMSVTPEQFKTWSQNLGHEKVLTTFLSYGEVACQRQGEIICNLATPQKSVPTGADEIAETVFKKFHSAEMSFRKKLGP